jgi:hypothetical protein
MGNVVGLATAAAISVAILNLQTIAPLSAATQLLVVMAVAASNLITWKRFAPPPMSAASAVKELGVGVALVLVAAAADVLIGMAVGERTLTGALIHSGAFGGVLDGFLAALFLVIGVPTLVRAVWLHYYQPASSISGDA